MPWPASRGSTTKLGTLAGYKSDRPRLFERTLDRTGLLVGRGVFLRELGVRPPDVVYDPVPGPKLRPSAVLWVLLARPFYRGIGESCMTDGKANIASISLRGSTEVGTA